MSSNGYFLPNSSNVYLFYTQKWPNFNCTTNLAKTEARTRQELRQLLTHRCSIATLQPVTTADVDAQHRFFDGAYVFLWCLRFSPRSLCINRKQITNLRVFCMILLTKPKHFDMKIGQRHRNIRNV